IVLRRSRMLTLRYIGTNRRSAIPQPCSAAHTTRIAVRVADQSSIDAIGEHPWRPQRRHSRVEALEVRHAAPQHNHIGVEDVDEVCERTSEPLFVARNGGLAR